jgi:hypothetical protein
MEQFVLGVMEQFVLGVVVGILSGGCASLAMMWLLFRER